jgi:beta-glucosidase
MDKNSNSEAKVEALLSKMTLQEKIGQMVQIAGPKGEIPENLRQQLREGRIGSMLNVTSPETNREIQRIAVEESRLGIPLIMGRDVIHGYRTIFPIPLAQAAAWDPQLAMACARVAAQEAASAGFQWTFAPMMDITRDPRWGRIAEGFGEDPYLASQFAAAMVRGFQGNNLAAPDSIAACAKHFAGYGAAEGGRDYDTASIPEGLLRDLYLPPFKAAVDAGTATIMTAFNEINGIPATGNMRLLRDILRKEWGFSRLVVSDWLAIAEMIQHGFCADLKDAAEKSITAGVDMEMQSSAYADHLEELVTSGRISMASVDGAIRRILEIKFHLGLFEKSRIYSAKAPAAPDAFRLRLAKQAALKSMVLLKNHGRMLPLSNRIRSLAVIGPMADDPYEVLGTWNRDGNIEDTVTPLSALKSYLEATINIQYCAGLEYSRSMDTHQFSKALELARQSDAVLMFVGEEAILSGEGHSRAHLNLPGAQEALVAEVAKSGKPLALIVLAGRPLILENILEKADAILYAWHPGTMCGPALVDLLFGIESPSGKLPVTFPKTEGQIPVYYNHKSTGRPPDSHSLTMIDEIPRRAYQSSLGDAARYLDIGYEPQFPFGFGLSYSEFSYSDLQLSSEVIHLGEILRIEVQLTNTGSMEAEEVTQLYIRDVTASITRPVRELKGFQRVRLKPLETRTVSFELLCKDLGFHDSSMQYIIEPGQFYLWVGSDCQAGLKASFICK